MMDDMDRPEVKAVERAAREFNKAKRAADRAYMKLAKAILKATDAGATRRTLESVAGISRSRIQQIIDGQDVSAAVRAIVEDRKP